MRAYSSSSQAFGYRIRIFDISRHMTTFGYHNRSGKNTRGDNLEYMNLNYRDTIIPCFLGLK